MSPRPLLAALSHASVLAFAMAGGSAHATPQGAPHAAACVAALKARETAMASASKPGTPVEPELLSVVQSGIAIIGTQYLGGLREGEARQLLDAAEHEFEALPASEAEARQAACLEEGHGLYQRASPIERSLITTAAERRIRRLRKG